jgi:hypothetical protein
MNLVMIFWTVHKLKGVIQFLIREIKNYASSSMSGENIKQKLWIILLPDY